MGMLTLQKSQPNGPVESEPAPDHEMPPMGGGAMSWGLAGFFVIPLILVIMVFAIPMCSASPEFDGTAPLYSPAPERDKSP